MAAALPYADRKEWLVLRRGALLSYGERQFFDYLVVLDFEATCEQDKSTQEPQEIIEFPAVLVRLNPPATAGEAASVSIVDEFRSYVKPLARPTLSAFCMKLTGIEQGTVEKADPFPVVYGRFLDWLRGHSLNAEVDWIAHQTSSGNRAAGERSFALLTHGDWDLQEMLPKQVRLSNEMFGGGPVTPSPLRIPPCMQSWLNLNAIFDYSMAITDPQQQFGPRGESGICRLAGYLGIPLLGRLHSGLDDSRNIAKIAMELVKLGVRMQRPIQVCYACQQPGHYKADCPALRASSGAVLPPPPPAAAVVQPHRRQGDWDCPKCGEVVFARRTECRMCGTRRVN